jgi:ABC-type antimicrobial peptide transport system permease subunit
LELMVGLVFSVITLLFASISTLLIYSLLMISTETKRYENGLMSVIGLSKGGYVGMIILQALLFVLPALILGFTCAVPGLAFIYSNLFTDAMGVTPTYWPSGIACLQAIVIGLLIPMFSAIIPIKIALSKTLSE